MGKKQLVTAPYTVPREKILILKPNVSLCNLLVGATGIEPVTPSMSRKCSPAELRARSMKIRIDGNRPVWSAGQRFSTMLAGLQPNDDKKGQKLSKKEAETVSYRPLFARFWHHNRGKQGLNMPYRHPISPFLTPYWPFLCIFQPLFNALCARH